MTGKSIALLVVVLSLPPLTGCTLAGRTSATGDASGDDGRFADVQARGAVAMGVDQYTSTHRFDALPEGGRIELQRDVDDPTGIAVIRAHLKEIQAAFGRGDFSIPAFIHAEEVPGTALMAERRDRIVYMYRDLPRGGELRLISRDPDVVLAIHEFMAYQRGDHRADGAHHPAADHSGSDHSHHAR